MFDGIVIAWIVFSLLLLLISLKFRFFNWRWLNSWRSWWWHDVRSKGTRCMVFRLIYSLSLRCCWSFILLLAPLLCLVWNNIWQLHQVNRKVPIHCCVVVLESWCYSIFKTSDIDKIGQPKKYVSYGAPELSLSSRLDFYYLRWLANPSWLYFSPLTVPTLQYTVPEPAIIQDSISGTDRYETWIILGWLNSLCEQLRHKNQWWSIDVLLVKLKFQVDSCLSHIYRPSSQSCRSSGSEVWEVSKWRWILLMNLDTQVSCAIDSTTTTEIFVRQESCYRYEI